MSSHTSNPTSVSVRYSSANLNLSIQSEPRHLVRSWFPAQVAPLGKIATMAGKAGARARPPTQSPLNRSLDHVNKSIQGERLVRHPLSGMHFSFVVHGTMGQGIGQVWFWT